MLELPSTQTMCLVSLGAGAVTAAVLSGAVLLMHWIIERRTPRVSHFDVGDELGTSFFECERWLATGGDCCPAGTTRIDCPGLAWLKSARRAAN